MENEQQQDAQNMEIPDAEEYAQKRLAWDIPTPPHIEAAEFRAAAERLVEKREKLMEQAKALTARKNRLLDLARRAERLVPKEERDEQ